MYGSGSGGKFSGDEGVWSRGLNNGNAVYLSVLL